jgi:hypothetical protein
MRGAQNYVSLKAPYTRCLFFCLDVWGRVRKQSSWLSSLESQKFGRSSLAPTFVALISFVRPLRPGWIHLPRRVKLTHRLQHATAASENLGNQPHPVSQSLWHRVRSLEWKYATSHWTFLEMVLCRLRSFSCIIAPFDDGKTWQKVTESPKC